MAPPQLRPVADLAAAAAAGADALVYVAPPEALKAGTADGLAFAAALRAIVEVDAGAASGVSAHVVADAAIPGRRLILSCTGPLSREYDDARRVTEAVVAGLRRAKAAGAVQPLLVLSGACAAGPAYDSVVYAALVAAAGSMHAPLTVRAAKGEAAAEPVTAIHVLWAGGAAGVPAMPYRLRLALTYRVTRKKLLAQQLAMAAAALACVAEPAAAAGDALAALRLDDAERDPFSHVPAAEGGCGAAALRAELCALLDFGLAAAAALGEGGPARAGKAYLKAGAFPPELHAALSDAVRGTPYARAQVLPRQLED